MLLFRANLSVDTHVNRIYIWQSQRAVQAFKVSKHIIVPTFKCNMRGVPMNYNVVITRGILFISPWLQFQWLFSGQLVLDGSPWLAALPVVPEGNLLSQGRMPRPVNQCQSTKRNKRRWPQPTEPSATELLLHCLSDASAIVTITAKCTAVISRPACELPDRFLSRVASQ